MKKMLALLLALVLTFAFSAAVFAEEPAAPANDPNAEIKAEISVLRDQLEGLRAEHKTIHDQAIAKRDTIKGLIKTSKEAGLTEKLEAAKAMKEQLTAISDEIKLIREDKTAVWTHLKAAKTQKDFETVKSDLTQIITYKQQIIDKANARLGMLDDIIASLQ